MVKDNMEVIPAPPIADVATKLLLKLNCVRIEFFNTIDKVNMISNVRVNNTNNTFVIIFIPDNAVPLLLLTSNC